MALLEEVNASLLLGAVLAFGAAAAYWYLGSRFLMLRTDADDDSRLALRLFGVWWTAFAVVALLQGAMNVLGGFGFLDVSYHAAATYLLVGAIVVSFWALVYYFLYLFTGRRRVLVPLSIYYGTLYVFLLYMVGHSEPSGVHVGTWQVRLTYAQRPENPLFAMILLLVLAPQVLGALAYFTLFFRFRDPTLRWRIGLVAGGIFVWFATLFLGNLAGLNRQDWWQLAARALGLGAALVAFLAYHPPGWARWRLHVQGLEDATPTSVALPGAGPGGPRRGQTPDKVAGDRG